MKMPQGSKMWMNRAVAEKDGIDVERLVRFHRMKGSIELYPDSPTMHDDGTATCHGCDTRKDYTVLYWQPFNVWGKVGLYGICRECTGTMLSLGPPSQDKRRLAEFAKMKPTSDPESKNNSRKNASSASSYKSVKPMPGRFR